MSLIVNVGWMFPFLACEEEEKLSIFKSFNLTEVNSQCIIDNEYDRWFYNNIDCSFFIPDKHLLYFLTRFCIKTYGSIDVIHESFYNGFNHYALILNEDDVSCTKPSYCISVYYKRDEYKDRENDVKTDIQSMIREFSLEKCLIVMLIGESYKLVFDLEVEIISYFRKIL